MKPCALSYCMSLVFHVETISTISATVTNTHTRGGRVRMSQHWRTTHIVCAIGLSQSAIISHLLSQDGGVWEESVCRFHRVVEVDGSWSYLIKYWYLVSLNLCNFATQNIAILHICNPSPCYLHVIIFFFLLCLLLLSLILLISFSSFFLLSPQASVVWSDCLS